MVLFFGRVLVWVKLLFAVGTGSDPAAAGIGQTVWRARLLDVLSSTADINGFIQNAGTHLQGLSVSCYFMTLLLANPIGIDRH